MTPLDFKLTPVMEKDELRQQIDSDLKTTSRNDLLKIKKFLKPSNSDKKNAFLYENEWWEIDNVQDFINIFPEEYRGRLYDFFYDEYQSLLDELDHSIDKNEYRRLNDEFSRLEDEHGGMVDILYDVVDKVKQRSPSKIMADSKILEKIEQFQEVCEQYILDDKPPTKDFLLYFLDFITKDLRDKLAPLKHFDETADRIIDFLEGHEYLSPT